MVGDAELLDRSPLRGTFDVIVFGNLIEHLSFPGRALEGVRRFMAPNSELVISTPKAFGLLANVRIGLGRFYGGNEHLAAYSRFTLPALLARH